MHIATVQLSADVLLGMLKPGHRHYTVESDIPSDAKLLGANYDSVRDVWVLRFESDNLPDIHESVEPPLLQRPLMLSYTCKEGCQC